MLPLLLLKTAQKHPVLVELKNGETYNGHMVQCDSWMNVHLREVICTSKDGDRFWRLNETYIRGNTIKYLRVPDEVIDKVKDESKAARDDKRPLQSNRGRGRGRGPGRMGDGGRGMRGSSTSIGYASQAGAISGDVGASDSFYGYDAAAQEVLYAYLGGDHYAPWRRNPAAFMESLSRAQMAEYLPDPPTPPAAAELAGMGQHRTRARRARRRKHRAASREWLENPPVATSDSA